jgi:hypothetical protein
MSRLTFGTAKTLFADFITSQGPTDPSVATALNFVIERFVKSGRWKGCRFTAYITPYDNQITTPENVETVDGIICIDDQYPNNQLSQPVNIQPDWYQFSTTGMGLFPTNYTGDTQCIRLGDGFCTYRDPQTATTFTVTKEALAETGNMTVKFKDSNGDPYWVNGVEGVTINLATDLPYTSPVATTGIYEVVKPLTTGRIFMGLTSPAVQIAIYSPAELNPNYQRYRIVGNYPEERTIYAMCKRAFITFKLDTDEVIPSNLNALRYGVQAYIYDQQNDLERAKVYWDMAFTTLNEELEDFTGDFTREQIEVQMGAFALGGPQGIPNLI